MMSLTTKSVLPFGQAGKYKLSFSNSVTPGRRVELTPMGSHTNLAFDVEDSGSFKLDPSTINNNNLEILCIDDPTTFHQNHLVDELKDSNLSFGDDKRQKISEMRSDVKDLLRRFGAEVLGTFLLVLFGDGSIAQVVLGKGNFSDFQSICFGYGFALMIGILASGGVSGGHLNPAVTLSLAAVKKCKWNHVPVYWVAQYLGAFLGASVVFGIYADAISSAGGKTADTRGIFASYPNVAIHPTTVTLAFDQMLGTALLVIIILSVLDERNMKIPSHLAPLFIGLGLCAIHISFGLNAGCAINPARDLSPRLLSLAAGWSVDDTFGIQTDSFFWIPWLLPHIGGVFGAAIYKVFIDMNHPS